MTDFVVHERYIRENPVKKRLVLEARDFRWSSASGAYAMDEVPQGLKPQKETGLSVDGTDKSVP